MSETQFHFKDSFMTAMKKVVEGKPICTGCSMRFFSHKDLERHLKYCDAQKKSGSEILPADRPSCNICGLVFISEYDLNLHNNAHKESQYDCDLCDKKFQKKLAFEKHQKAHKGKQFCTMCDILFSSAKEYEDHKRQKHKDIEDYMSYICQYCHKHFAKTETLKQHVQQVHREEEKEKYRRKPTHNLGVFMCTLCKRRFTTYVELEEHISNHSVDEKLETKTELEVKVMMKAEKMDNEGDEIIYDQARDNEERLQIQDTVDDDEIRDTPPQLSPVTTVSESQSVHLRPPALEAVEQRDIFSAQEQQSVKQLPTKMFAKGHGPPSFQHDQKKETPVLSSKNPNLKNSSHTTSPVKTVTRQGVAKLNMQLSDEGAPTQPTIKNFNSNTRSSPQHQQFVKIVPKMVAVTKNTSSPTIVSPAVSESSDPKVGESEARRPSAVWLRHLEKMKAVVARQKQYEQELHLQKVNYGEIKLISDIRRTPNKISDEEGPEVKRLKPSQPVNSVIQNQNQENTTTNPELKQVKEVANSTGLSSASNSNGTDIKSPVKYARKSPVLLSKMAQKLQREEERREKFIKKHEDLLNQELVEGEIPAAVLNEKLVDETNTDKSALEIEVKLDDGSTSVLFTE